MDKYSDDNQLFISCYMDRCLNGEIYSVLRIK